MRLGTELTGPPKYKGEALKMSAFFFFLFFDLLLVHGWFDLVMGGCCWVDLLVVHRAQYVSLWA